jgi:hypothetical protein
MKQQRHHHHQSFATRFAFLLIILHLQSHGSDALYQQTWISSPLVLHGPRTPEELQTALNAASDGDIIDLLPISYTGDFILQSRNPTDKITIRGNSQVIIDEFDDEPVPVKEVKKPWFSLSGLFPKTKTVPVPISRKYSKISKSHTRIVGKEAAFKLMQGDWTITSLSIESGFVAAKEYNGKIVHVLGVPTCAVNKDFWPGVEAIGSSGCGGGTNTSSSTALITVINANNGTATKLKLMKMIWNSDEEEELFDSNKEGMSSEEYLRKFDLIVPTGHEQEQELLPTCNA